MTKRSAAALAALLLAAPAMAQIYKCPDASGRTVIQQLPCEGGKALDVKPASGHAPATPAPASSHAAPAGAVATHDAADKKGVFDDEWRRRYFLENRGVPEARAALVQHRAACERKLKELEASKASANNNLAGATYLQSISAQMQAEATMCDMRGRELLQRKEAFEKELAELQAKP